MKKPDFIWNYEILKDFVLQRISHRWLVPIIQGYCNNEQEIMYLQKPLNMILISRRSTARAGTRFYSRGIDEQGNVSNFVETEMIVLHNNGTCTFSHM